MAGSAEFGQGDQAHATMSGNLSYGSKPYWQKLLVSLGGILFNLLFAYIIFSGLFLAGSSNKQAVMVVDVVKDSAAEQAGLKTGDAIIGLSATKLAVEASRSDVASYIDLVPNGSLLADAQQLLLGAIQANPGTEVVLKLERNHEELDLPILLREKNLGGQTIGSLGANFLFPLPRLPLFQAIKAGISYTNQNILLIIESIKRLFSQRSLEGAGGPLMIISMSATSAQHGTVPLLIFLALLSINLALINLLPIGALDGGQILFITIEAITRRKIPMAIKNTIDIGSWVMFLSLFAFLTYRDILHLFGAKINTLISLVSNLF
jgi:regulator of sigma E protease